MSSAQLLLAAIDGGGTVPPALGVAAELVRRGHYVRVLADPTVESSARAAGCEFTPWARAPHFDTLADQTAAIGAAEHGSPGQRLRVVSRFTCGDATRGFADDVLSVVRAHATDGVLVEAVLPGMLYRGRGVRPALCRPDGKPVSAALTRAAPAGDRVVTRRGPAGSSA